MRDRTSVVTTEQIRKRFSATQAPSDPAKAELPPGAERLPAEFLAEMAGPLIVAAVLIPLIQRPDGIRVLFTERSADLKSHAGQVSFPGGRKEPGDGDVVETALRETWEEVGIRPEQVEILGFLGPTTTVTKYAVTPVVGLVDPDFDLKIDPVEVQSAFEVPLDFLLDRENQETAEREFAGRMIPMTSFYFGRQRIWGATAGMVISFREALL